MTISEIPSRVGFGNMLQLLVLAVTLTGAGVLVRAQTEANAASIEKVDVRVSKYARDTSSAVSNLADRVQRIEVREATVVERVTTIQRDVSDIERGVEANRQMLIQLLRRRDIE